MPKSNQEVKKNSDFLRNSLVENAIFFPSHDVLWTHFVSKFQSEDSKGNFIEFSTDIIFQQTRFEQSNFARIFNLIAFLRRSKTISSGCLPRNCRMTANSSLQWPKILRFLQWRPSEWQTSQTDTRELQTTGLLRTLSFFPIERSQRGSRSSGFETQNGRKRDVCGLAWRTKKSEESSRAPRTSTHVSRI